MRVFMTVALAGCALIGSAQLVGHWKFDELAGVVAADSSGFGNNGTMSGAAGFATGGVSGGCGLFISSGNGMARMGNVHGMMGTSFTLSSWVNTLSTGNEIVVGKHQSGFLNGHFLATNAGAGYGLPNKGYFYGSNSPGSEPISTSNVNTGNWVMMTGVYDLAGGTVKMYVDGSLEKTVTLGFFIQTSVADFAVAGIMVGTNYVGSYNGAVDDVQLYNRALTASEIVYLHTNPGAVVPEPATFVFLGGGFAAMVFMRLRRRS